MLQSGIDVHQMRTRLINVHVSIIKQHGYAAQRADVVHELLVFDLEPAATHHYQSATVSSPSAFTRSSCVYTHSTTLSVKGTCSSRSSQIARQDRPLQTFFLSICRASGGTKAKAFNFATVFRAPVSVIHNKAGFSAGHT